MAFSLSWPLLSAGRNSVLRGGGAWGGLAKLPNPQLTGLGLPFPFLDQQRAPEACERGDSAKQDERRGRNTESAQLDGVKFPCCESHGEQGSGVLPPQAQGQLLKVQLFCIPALESGVEQENSLVGFVFSFPFPERSSQTGLACDGVGGKAILPEEEEMPSSVPSRKH